MSLVVAEAEIVERTGVAVSVRSPEGEDDIVTEFYLRHEIEEIVLG